MKKIALAMAALVCGAMVFSCQSNGTITKGSASQFDSLSYFIGANIGTGVRMDFSDVPFNHDLLDKGIVEGALKKTKQTQDEAIEILRDYFVAKRLERQKLTEERNVADSSLIGDLSLMFETQGECDTVSYSFGNDIGTNVRNSKLPLKTYWLVKGLEDAYAESEEIDEEQMQKFLQNYFMVVRPAELAAQSEAWLKKMGRKLGVKKTESGLLYKVVRKGDATKMATDDRDVVVVNYEGKTADGEVFDSSYERGEPAEFPLNRVIKGWTEGCKLVGEGGEVILYIPSELAYGQRGAGRAIAPNAALEFKVEILEVKPYVEPEAEQAEPAAEVAE